MEYERVPTSSLPHSFLAELGLRPWKSDIVRASKLLHEFGMVRYWILRKAKPHPANFEPASWFKPRKGKLKQVKRIRLASATRSARKPSLLKIMREQAREKSSKLRNADDQEIG